MKFLHLRFSWHIVVILVTLAFLGGAHYGTDVGRRMQPPPKVYVIDRETLRYAKQYGTSYFLSAVIIRNAEEYRIPKPLAFRLVWTESRFNPRAVSPKGAIGLTQVMPRTAYGLDSTLTRQDLFDPEMNVDLGFRYLRMMRVRYDGDWQRALIAYNAGPRTADTTTTTEHTYADYILNR